MITKIVVTERGATPGILKREFNRITKNAWDFSAKRHHTQHVPARFTPAHAVKARYHKRKGQGLPQGSRGFKRSYYGRKLRSKFGGGVGRADPLVWTGKSKEAARFATVTSTRSGAKLRYRTPTFNRRHPKSRIRMSEEFRRVLDSERTKIAEWLDESIESQVDAITTTKTTRIV